MRFSCYESTPSRFHPQFLGIAERYAEYKKQNLASQHKRKQLFSGRAYSIKVNEKMEKQLYTKTLELSRLKQAKQRHLQDINYKQMLYQKRQQEIRNLRDNNNKERFTLKNNIQLARQNLLIKKERNKQHLQQESKLNDSRLKQLLQKRKQQNSLRRKQIKEDQQTGQSRVDEFFRQQNEKSLQAYRARIVSQIKERSRQKRKIKKYQRQIATINNTVKTKREQLEQIESQIKLLTFRPSSMVSDYKSKRRQFTDTHNHTDSNISLNSDKNPEYREVDNEK